MGAYRLRENGATIDVSGQLDGVEYDDAVGLSQTLRDHPSLGPCLARTMFRYALGRDPTRAEWEFVDDLGTSFASAGFRVSALVEELVLSESFLQASGAREAELLEQER